MNIMKSCSPSLLRLGKANVPDPPPLSGSKAKVNGFVLWPISHPSTKFQLSSCSLILLTNQQTNKQTRRGENITSLLQVLILVGEEMNVTQLLSPNLLLLSKYFLFLSSEQIAAKQAAAAATQTIAAAQNAAASNKNTVSHQQLVHSCKVRVWTLSYGLLCF